MFPGEDRFAIVVYKQVIKGSFWTAMIETEGAFDVFKLQLDLMMVVEDRIQLVTGATYEAQKLKLEWVDDYSSRGLVGE